MPTRQSSDHLHLVGHLMPRLTGLPTMGWCSQNAFQHLQMLVVVVSLRADAQGRSALYHHAHHSAETHVDRFLSPWYWSTSLPTLVPT